MARAPIELPEIVVEDTRPQPAPPTSSSSSSNPFQSTPFTAELHVNGMIFQDWESILVRHALLEDPPYMCRFTCSEGMPLNKNYALLRIKPGDDCTVYLAGFLALSGKVIVRQVYYDAFRHHIEIQAATYSYEASRKTVQSKTNEFNKMNFHQLARSILGPIGVGYRAIGKPISNETIPRTSVIPGQSCREVLEQCARAVGAIITSDPQGNFVVTGGSSGGSDEVVEGKNILIGREIIRNMAYSGKYPQSAQLPGNDKKNGPDVTHVPHQVNDALQSSASLEGISRMINEMPGWSNTIIKSRANFEGINIDMDAVYVNVTVHGWLRPSGGLWEVDQMVHVYSPMLIMNNDLRLRAVTFTQDNPTGSRSTLELVNDVAAGNRPRIPQSAQTP